MATNPTTRLTPEQYLEIERKAEFKSEYFNGEMFAMAGAGYAHNLVTANLIATLNQQLRTRPCQVLSGDMRIHVAASDLYTYPDASVVCGEPKFLGNRTDTLLNPSLVVEVLSPSTEAYDRGRKFEHYQSIESVSEYLLISSDRVHADLFTRRADGAWELRRAAKPEDSLELQSIGVRLTLSDLYDKVDLTQTAG